MRNRAIQPASVRLALAAMLLGGALATGGVHRAAEAQAAPPPAAVATPLPSLAGVIERVTPAVVNIRVEKRREGGPVMPGDRREFMRRFFGERAPLPNPDRRPVTGQGSGFVIAPDGHIVTNHHVVDGAEEVAVTFHDRRRLAARVVGVDPKTDLALLKVDAPEPLAHVAFGDSDAVRVGDWVVALGNPFGLGHSATTGIVSARGRNIGAGPYDDFLQISAPINRGNSGGPTFNLEGEVVGVNTAILSPSGGSVGIGFAIPAALAGEVVAELQESGSVERGRLGVQVQRLDDDLAASLGMEKAQGALVASVEPSGPAAAAGLEAGDVILEVAGEPVAEMRQLPRMVAAHDPGETVALALWRNGARQEVRVTLGAMPASERPMRLAEAGGDLDGLKLGERQGRVVVEGVAPESLAADKGVRPGDILVSVDRQAVASAGDVGRIVAGLRAAGKSAALLLFRRDGQDRFVALPFAMA